MTINLSPELEQKLALEAAAIGQSLEDVFASLADEWLRRRALERAEDEEDLRVGLEVLRNTKPEEWIPWEQVKAELDAESDTEHAALREPALHV